MTGHLSQKPDSPVKNRTPGNPINLLTDLSPNNFGGTVSVRRTFEALAH